MFLFSLPVQKAALDCERMRKTNGKFHLLYSSTKAVFTEAMRWSALSMTIHEWVFLCFLMNNQRGKSFPLPTAQNEVILGRELKDLS